MDIYDRYKNSKIVNSISDDFDVCLKEYKVYNQDDSLLCWIYAGCNTIKYDISKSINVDMDKIDISINYLSFYDRYEKINKVYDEIIYNNYDNNNVKYLLFNYVNPYGDFNHFKYLVNKYGIVFEEQMPMTDNNYIPHDIDNLLKQKIIVDIDELNATNKLEKKLELKKKYMKELYEILSSIFGTPPKNTIIDNINIPVEDFYNNYVKNIINEYVGVCCLENIAYNKYYDINFLDMKIDDYRYYNLEINDLKHAIIQSLDNEEPVWFGCSFRYISASRRNHEGILDDRLYNFNSLGIKKLSKSLAEKYNMLDYTHAMVFTGYSSNPKKWQVLNTFGENHNRNGYFIMNDNFFDSSVFIIGINKKFL
ncbi:MAG: hypothetical protein IJ094_05070 [Bacilli bacterium]|nr:hypothetical protein [Bacilli bacterium]